MVTTTLQGDVRNLNRTTLIKKAIRQTQKTIQLVTPDRSKCLVCRYFKKGEIPYDLCATLKGICPLKEQCLEYVNIMNLAVDSLEIHKKKLIGMLET